MPYTMKKVENPHRVLSWGIGVQSTCLGVMSVNGIIPKYEYILTADTGWEHEHTIKAKEFYTDYFEKNGIQVHECKADGPNIKDTKEYVLPLFPKEGGPITRQCTGFYKIEPSRRYIRSLYGLHPTGRGRTRRGFVELSLGISLDEAIRMKDSKTNWIENAFPLVDLKWTRDDCIKYLLDLGLPVPEKSSCVCCPYHSAEAWLSVKKLYPKDWEDAVLYDKRFREPSERMKKHGFTQSLYLWKGREPLDEVDFEKVVDDRGNSDICETGYCFV